MIYRRSVFPRDECALARFLDSIRYHLHRAVERYFRPRFRAWRAILHFRLASRMREQLIRGSPFRTKVTLTNRRFRIALDRNQLAVLVINQLPATDATVR